MQHTIVSAAHQLLEEVFFEFGQRWIPDVLAAQRPDCPAAVELTRWPSILARLPVGQGAPRLDTHHVVCLYTQMRRLRNVSCHRISVFGTELAVLVKDAAEVIGDGERAALLRVIYCEVVAALEAIRAERVAINGRAEEGELAQIIDLWEDLDQAVAGDALDEMWREIVAGIRKEDEGHRLFVGEVLHEAVTKAMGRWAAIGRSSERFGDF